MTVILDQNVKYPSQTGCGEVAAGISSCDAESCVVVPPSVIRPTTHPTGEGPSVRRQVGQSPPRYDRCCPCTTLRAC